MKPTVLFAIALAVAAAAASAPPPSPPSDGFEFLEFQYYAPDAPPAGPDVELHSQDTGEFDSIEWTLKTTHPRALATYGAVKEGYYGESAGGYYGPAGGYYGSGGPAGGYYGSV